MRAWLLIVFFGCLNTGCVGDNQEDPQAIPGAGGAAASSGAGGEASGGEGGASASSGTAGSGVGAGGPSPCKLGTSKIGDCVLQ